MKSEDLRSKIIPTLIVNTDSRYKSGNKEFETKDLIYLDGVEDRVFFKPKKDKISSATDYALMNNIHAIEDFYDTTRTDKIGATDYLRYDIISEEAEYYYGLPDKPTVYVIENDGSVGTRKPNSNGVGLKPSLHYKLPKEGEEFDIREVKDKTGEIIYHTLQIGELPKTKVDENLSKILETLYNGGKINEEISCTGRWYSVNPANQEDGYGGKHSPEFEYKNDRYVRNISEPNYESQEYSDGTIAGKRGTVRWAKVEPISFIIKNWEDMPKSINPNGNGKAKYFDLIAEETIIANIPFYPSDKDKYSMMWQNSTPRGFLNGIDVRNITKNGNPEFGAPRGGNFTGECNFLNEAFNLSRQPIIEYAIPDSETEIPHYAFNGCISLKKLVIHSGIKKIGKRAFDGLKFKYVYRTEQGDLIFSQDIPKNKEVYKDIIELRKIEKAFGRFDYGDLIQSERMDNITKFSENLNKNRFSIPYIYGLALIDKGKDKSFCDNSDFRFFKNEMPNINDELLKFPEEEMLDFFKFAKAIGCFSTERVVDKKGKETDVLLAQKSSSLLAKLLKTDEMKLR